MNTKSRTDSGISKVIIDGLATTDPQNISKGFNNYFCNVGVEFSKRLSKNVSNNFQKYMGASVTNSFFSNDVNMQELKKIVVSLKPFKSSVGDTLSSDLLTECFNYLSLPFLFFSRLCDKLITDTSK